MTIFPQQMKKYRHAKGLTQQELADLLGVSNKTVSRWESDGGYPDVTMLVPLARALGVTVDDLLDSQRPVRTLTKTDWQSLLSYVFALGGGVLFYLFDLFMPAALCYLAYLGCMAYGVYLQKYYAYRSRWFFLSNAVMDLAVSVSLIWGALSGVLNWLMSAGLTMTTENQKDLGLRLVFWLIQHKSLLYLPGLLLAAAVAAATQWLVLSWSRGRLGEEPLFQPGYRLRLGRPDPAHRLLLPLLPAAQLMLWVSYTGGDGLPVWAARYQEGLFLALLALSALLCLLLFRRKGERKWAAWGLALVLLGATAGAGWSESMLLNTRNGMSFPYQEIDSVWMLPYRAWRPELLLALAALTVLAALLCFVRLERREPSPPEEKTREA